MKEFKIPKREMDVVILSDVHLGTFGCRAQELLRYLQSIRPKILILNGDIIDIWQFRKRYFPKSHMMVIRQIMGMIAKKTRVVYITGNHDELLRRFVDFKLGSFELVNKLVLELDGKKAWIFHGDVFDVTMQYSKWLARLGSIGYDLLILMNSVINGLLTFLGKDKISFSRRIKNSVKGAVTYINKFEETAAGIAISNGYSYVICGHIHHPEIRKIENTAGSVTYLNSGDWIENLSALEYSSGNWTVYRYADDDYAKSFRKFEKRLEARTDKQLFEEFLKEMKLVS